MTSSVFTTASIYYNIKYLNISIINIENYILIVTARRAIDQRCSESNGLPIDEDTKLKKRRTFRRDTRYIYYQ